MICLYKQPSSTQMPFAALRDDVSPYIAISDHLTAHETSRGISWNIGEIQLLRSRFRTLHISVRGLSYTNVPLSHQSLQTWNRFTNCFPVNDALCKPAKQNMLFFSSNVVDIPDSWSQMEANIYTDMVFNQSACQKNGGGRIVTPEDTRYEVSLCDILDMNMRFLYDGVDNIMYWKQDNTSLVELICVSILSIYFVSSLSHNLLHIFQKESIKTSHETLWVQLIVVLATTLYIYINLFIVNTGMLVLHTDQVLFIQLCLFIFVEICGQAVLAIHTRGNDVNTIHEFTVKHFEWHNAWYKQVNALMQIFPAPVPHNRDGYISILTACLLLISCRVHYTFDTPYLSFLVVVFGTRSIYKLLRIIDKTHDPGKIEYFLWFIDICIYASLIGNGLLPASINEVQLMTNVHTSFFISFVFGFLLWYYKVSCIP